MTSLPGVLRADGLPMALYTDWAHWAFHTPTAKGPVDKTHLTQPGRALAHLGIGHIPSYSPQACGRSERLNRTFQDRLVNELRVAGIATLDAANRYLTETFVPQHNATFACAPRDPASAFVPLGAIDLDAILCHQETRMVGRDNTVSLERQVLQIAAQPGRRTCSGLEVTVRRHLDGGFTITRGAHGLGRYDACGQPVDAAAPTGSTLAKAVRSLVKRKRTDHSSATPDDLTQGPLGGLRHPRQRRIRFCSSFWVDGWPNGVSTARGRPIARPPQGLRVRVSYDHALNAARRNVPNVSALLNRPARQPPRRLHGQPNATPYREDSHVRSAR